ncbi:Trm112 family protein [Desulfovibrio litoralis]|uniref:UPF0434 protein SAMN02745728_01359 n=1 Tax=Desulfovibrio litoralis DSM 11393 TaxID=1121455 RepID=A0A1M7SXL2_9BACT|nr:Trm112 family protein [Desulfovibrio litoralis]SHN63263.1 hypothetical protein SAMN02745728_01359 [Desulfovibrio litoralis DSM 11393]
MALNKELLDILACPVCKGDLELIVIDNQECGLSCAACKLVFPIKDEIPIMLKEDAIPFSEWENKKQHLN